MLRMFTILLHLVCVTLCLQLQQGVYGNDQCEHPPKLQPNSGLGTVTTVGPLKAYVTGPERSRLAVILVSDYFGCEAPNLRKVADKVATKAGFNVVVPDFFNGDPYNPNNTQRPVELWLRKDHETVLKAKRLIADLRRNGMKRIGVAGLCWGVVKTPVSVLADQIDNGTSPELVNQLKGGFDC